MALFLYQDGLVAALKQMSHGSVAPVVELGIDTVQLAHSFGEVSLWCFDYQVVVVVHQTVGVAEPVKAVNDLAEGVQEGFAISIVIEDVFSGVTSGGRMVDCTVKFDSERAGHELGNYQSKRQIARYKT